MRRARVRYDMELWDGYRADGTLAGVDLARGRPIPPGLYRAVAEVLVRHRDGTFLLTRRDPGKDLYPGLWEAGAGGAVLKGERFREGAVRELREETGLAAGTLRPLYVCTAQSALFRGYLCVTGAPKDSVVLQPGETAAYRWVSGGAFARIMASDAFVPTQRERLRGVLGRIL